MQPSIYLIRKAIEYKKEFIKIDDDEKYWSDKRKENKKIRDRRKTKS